MLGVARLTRIHARFLPRLEQLTASGIQLLALLLKLAHALYRTIQAAPRLANLRVVLIQLGEQLGQLRIDAQQALTSSSANVQRDTSPARDSAFPPACRIASTVRDAAAASMALTSRLAP